MIKYLEQLISDPSFRRFISNEADESEKLFWLRWIDSSPENQDMYDEALFLLKKFHIESQVKTDDLKDWSDLEYQINSEEDKIHQFNTLQKRVSTFRFLMRYAAIFVVISLVGMGFWLMSNSKDNSGTIAKISPEVSIETGFSELKTINLNDGSKIILAPNSQIIYKKGWLKEPIKKLRLYGEAYFNISEKNKNSGKAKFKIMTTQGVIRDYGTKFNVSTFDNKTLVVLEYGIVSVSKVKDQKSSVRMLDAGQMAMISDQKSDINIKKVNTRVYTSWKTKTLYFDDTPLSFFVSYLKNFYGLHVVVRDSTLLDKQLSDGIDRSSVKNMLDVISHVLNIKMYQQGDTVYIGADDSFSASAHN